MSVTKNVAKYVSDIGINLSELARKADISYSSVYASLGNASSDRELRADELVRMCKVLRVNPMMFFDGDTPAEESNPVDQF